MMPRDPVDILFVATAGPDEHRSDAELCRLVRAEGLRPGFLTQTRRTARKLTEAGYQAASIHDLAEGRPAPADVPLDEIERRYGLTSFRDLCFPEAAVLDLPEDRVFPRARLYLDLAEQVMEAWTPRLVVQNSGAELIRRAVFTVARRAKVTHYFIRPTPFPQRITFSVDSELGDWSHLDFQAGGAPDPAEITLARDFVAAFRDKKKPLAKVNVPRVTTGRLRLWLTLLKERWTGRGEFLGPWEPYGRTLRYANAWIKAQILRFRYRRVPTTPYFFFPIHVWHDSAITVRAPQFLRQHHLIATLADAMPQGYTLVVKEHPAAVGRNPLRAMLELRRLRNVVLVNPRTSSHELVEKASAVVVVNSTAGFEALAYHKPVVVLGNAFYSRRGLTLDVDNLFDLRSILARAPGFRADPDKIDLFFRRAHQTTFPGWLVGDGVDLSELVRTLAKQLPPRA